ncbi:MAG: phosphotransferase [Defluviitaleaceae bacterium]|nr:phosphotransferase [Defluviitaleaceae bacterium]
MFFSEKIDGKESWEDLKLKPDVFRPLIENIFLRESLPFSGALSARLGSNAVFKAGNYIVKIFPPSDSGLKGELYYDTELYGQSRAISIGVPTPKILASGIMQDKYNFPYIVSEFIDSVELGQIFNSLTPAEKCTIGQKLREISDQLNTSCEPFNGIKYPETVIEEGYNGWLTSLGYQKAFLEGRSEYIRSLEICKNDLVFCHGDMADCNILYSPGGKLHIIDFAASVLAPVCVDYTYIIFWTGFDKSLIQGFFGEISIDELVNICFNGFLLSIYSMGMLVNGAKHGFIDGKACTSIDDFKAKLHDYIKK